MRILITAGPTREFFDTVRFISNPSSGKMGYALAAQAAKRKHEVILVTGPVELSKPKNVQCIDVVSAEEMFRVCTSLFEECDAAIMTAAVCDYRPTRQLDHKLKKQNRVRPIHLQPTTDICAHLGGIKDNRIVIGFAMEDRHHHTHAQAKLRRKHCDAIVLNSIDNVASDNAEIEILRADTGWSKPISGTKLQLALIIIHLVEKLSSRT